MVDDVVEPATAVILVGLAVMLKAVATLKITVEDRLRLPLLPETVTVNVGVDVVEGVQERIDDPEDEAVVRVMLAGLRLHVRPEDGEIMSFRLTVPVKPLAPETVIVDAPLVPAKTKTEVGLALTVKSCTV